MTRVLPLYGVLVVIAVLVRSSFVVALTVALGVFAFAASAHVSRVARRVVIRRELVDRAFTGDDVTVRLVVENGSRLPVPWLEIGDAVPQALLSPRSAGRVAIGLRGRETRTVAYELRCHRRGYHQVGPMRAEVGGYFGTASRRLPEIDSSRLIVYPRVREVERLGLPARAPMADLAHTGSLLEDPYRIAGVRDYRAGDGPRVIEWAATARSGRLVVKQFEPAISRDLMILLDLTRSHFSRGGRSSGVELAIMTAASIAHHVVVREKLAVGVLTHGTDPLGSGTGVVPIGRGAGHLMQALELLARVDSIRDDAFAQTLEVEAPRFPFGASLLVLTGTLDAALSSTLMRLERHGHPVLVGLIDPSRGDPRFIGRIPVHHINGPSDLAVIR